MCTSEDTPQIDLNLLCFLYEIHIPLPDRWISEDVHLNVTGIERRLRFFDFLKTEFDTAKTETEKVVILSAMRITKMEIQNIWSTGCPESGEATPEGHGKPSLGLP